MPCLLDLRPNAKLIPAMAAAPAPESEVTGAVTPVERGFRLQTVQAVQVQADQLCNILQ